MGSNVISNPLPPSLQLAVAGKARSHGFLPLFLSQFLLLGGVAGAIAALVKLPESKWAELTQVGKGSGDRQVAACGWQRVGIENG